MDKYTPRHGSGFPAWEHAIFTQSATQKTLRDAFADYISISDSFIVDGCLITETAVGTATQYAMTAGTVCLRGEFMPVAAQTILKALSMVIYFAIDDVPIDPSPDVNIDGQTDYVMRQRSALLAVGVAYPVDSVSIALPRKGDLDLLRLKGRIVPKGGILPYYGDMSSFDATGLGLVSTAMEGFAVCNGQNNTIDMRGLVPLGATNVPASGAGVVSVNVDGTSSLGDLVGADKVALSANNLPKHKHDQQGLIYGVGTGDVASLVGGNFKLHAASDGAVQTEENATTEEAVSVKQASRSLVFIQSIL